MEKLRQLWVDYLAGASGRFEGYRTHLLAFLTFLLGVLDVVDPYALSSIIPFQYQGYLFIGYSVLQFLLRQITKTESPIHFRRKDNAGTTEGTE